MVEGEVVTIYIEDGKIKDKGKIPNIISYKTLKGIIDNLIKYSNEEDESSLYVVYKDYHIILQKDLFYEDQDNYFVYVVNKEDFHDFIKSKKITPTEVPTRKIIKKNKTLLLLIIVFLLTLIMAIGVFIYIEKKKEEQRIALEKIKQEQIKKEQEEKKLQEEQQKKQQQQTNQLQQLQTNLQEQTTKTKIKSINAIALAINNIDEQKKKYKNKVGIKQLLISPEQVLITYELDDFQWETKGTYNSQTNTIVYTKEEKIAVSDKNEKIVFSQRKKSCFVELSKLGFKFTNSDNNQVNFNINQQIKNNSIQQKESSKKLLSITEVFLRQFYYVANSCGNNISITNLVINENSINGVITLWL